MFQQIKNTVKEESVDLNPDVENDAEIAFEPSVPANEVILDKSNESFYSR